MSLDQLEHEWIRGRFAEPRIHWAVVCAAISCPPLRSEPYTGRQLEQQLAQQAERVHAGRWVRYAKEANILHLTPLYDWYANDFEQAHGSVLDAVARYLPAVGQALEAGQPPKIRWLDYDWSLNVTAR